jgi:hypothetical protein
MEEATLDNLNKNMGVRLIDGRSIMRRWLK